MAYTVMSNNGSEIYKNEINRLFDEYIQSELKIDPDEFRDPDNKKTVRDNFGDMILYIADHIEKPSNDDIELLDSIFEIYKRLCVRCGMLPTLETFSDLVSINNATFTDWANGEYRARSAHGKTVKKWKEECRGKLVDSLHQQSGTNANRIFIAKAAYGMVETAPLQLEAINNMAPALSQEDIRQIADQARKESIPELLDSLPDE